MKSDPHLIEAEVPLVEGEDYVGLCGKAVPRSKFVLMFDSVEMAVPMRLLNFRCCRKCVEAIGDQPVFLGKREHYVYGIVSAGEETEIEAA